MPRWTLRTLVAFPSIILTTGVFSVLAILCIACGSRDRGVEWVIATWSPIIARIAGMRLRVVGTERVDPSRSYVVVSNHQSHMDVIALYLSSPVPLRMLAKLSLFRIPVFGWAMRLAGHVPIDRRSGQTNFRALKKSCESLLRFRRSISIFAEGTRSDDGHVQNFKLGAFKIAQELGLDIVPVSITGTRDVLPARSLRCRAADAAIVWHDPIAVTPDDDPAALADRVRERVVAGMANDDP
ncbi:MAG: 1-acyl-sn-glycerol-3-phosphate acyltransferase [Deltaproteobacteria bacterium]|nr:1-acyl-sn-glycerol-3-phosphate acyltransferase [Deltaproteobacteria bacterium]